MALFKIIVQKMLNNKWLTCSLFLGLIMTVSLVSSIPTYTSSVLHKLLVKELEQHQLDHDQFPGEFSFLTSFSDGNGSVETTGKIEKINQQLTSDINLPKLANATVISTVPFSIYKENAEEAEEEHGRFVSLTNIKEHMTLTDGRLPENNKQGIIEVLVPERTLKKRGIVLNNRLRAVEENQTITVIPVGTFRAKDQNDPYWSIPPERYTDDFIVLEDLFQRELLKDEFLGSVRFYTAWDYHAIENHQFTDLLQLEGRIKAEISDVIDTDVISSFPIADILISYDKKEEQLKTMLWSLNIPVLVMLSLYLFMVSRLIVNRQLNEIAVLSSRGATRMQIMKIYLIEIGILGVISFFIGPQLGILMCKLLGGTNGFLQFVQREALPIRAGADSYFYAAIALLTSIVMVMIPVYQGSKQSIVHQKQKSVKAMTKTNWITMIIGAILLGISVYGLYVFSNRKQSLNQDGFVDPMLFFIPALFIIGLGVILLYLYPFLLGIIYKLGKRYWNLSLYSTFIQVSRSISQYQFLMLFLIMTIGVGVFSASAARTLNENFERQIRYENGADLTLDVKWESNEVQSPPSGAAAVPPTESAPSSGAAETPVAAVEKEIVFTEPSFEPFLNINEIEHAAKVLRVDGVKAEAKGKSLYSYELMGIEPKEFGQTAWFHPSLLQHHWYSYLNLLAKEPSSVLISRSVAASLGVKEGDYIKLNGNSSVTMEVVVYGIIDYWPGFLPEKEEEDEEKPALIVGNLPYFQNAMGLEPYEVWLKIKPDASRASLYKHLQQEGIPVLTMQDVHPQLVELKNSAFLLGLNGSLTLGFIISIMIAFIGFLLFWILTIKARVLQYGVYRAMGIPLRKLIGILLYEQLFTSGFACLLGLFIGGLTSILFVPLFHLSMDSQLPFHVLFDVSDERKIYFFVSFMLIVGLTILVMLVKKIKIYQAIKLGED
ncbi:hypothetical protein WQ54_00990 [Bacillus sp. SA1-12]|uniref:ABC transporter permease n=1 Tax=Bacillus sp. SA1-12 TaxID=1455638 RepID=UPI0006269104|nr:FtsX-like permease family protein [Bacillus sp. SA1-12]KKI94144.1 hypothetical protein WQ54_00990 [Bacillus sp. SA1-12]